MHGAVACRHCVYELAVLTGGRHEGVLEADRKTPDLAAGRSPRRGRPERCAAGDQEVKRYSPGLRLAHEVVEWSPVVSGVRVRVSCIEPRSGPGIGIRRDGIPIDLHPDDADTQATKDLDLVRRVLELQVRDLEHSPLVARGPRRSGAQEGNATGERSSGEHDGA